MLALFPRIGERLHQRAGVRGAAQREIRIAADVATEKGLATRVRR